MNGADRPDDAADDAADPPGATRDRESPPVDARVVDAPVVDADETRDDPTPPAVAAATLAADPPSAAAPAEPATSVEVVGSEPARGAAADPGPAPTDPSERGDLDGGPRPRPRLVWLAFDRDALGRIEAELRAASNAPPQQPTRGASSSASEAAMRVEPSPGTADLARAEGSATDDSTARGVVASAHATAPARGAATSPAAAHEAATDAAMEVSAGEPASARGGAPIAAPTAPAHPASTDGNGATEPPAATTALMPKTSEGGLEVGAEGGTHAPHGHAHEPVSGRRRADLAVFPFFADERPLGGLLGLFDWRAAGRFTRLIDDEGARAGDVGHAVLTLGGRTLPAQRVVLLGLGETSAFGEEAAQRAAARIGAIVRDLRPRSVLFGVSPAATQREALDAFIRVTLDAAEETPVTWILCVEPRALARLRRRLEAEPIAERSSP